jgi:hypothetical protein
MKKFFQYFLLLIFGAVTTFMGAALENHEVYKHSGDPMTVIGVQACKKFLGVLIVTRDGVVHPAAGVTREAAQQMADALPNEGLITTPCDAGVET